MRQFSVYFTGKGTFFSLKEVVYYVIVEETTKQRGRGTLN